MAPLFADIRYAVRSFGRTPGLTAVVVLTLALGIGMTTAIFSVVDGVLLKPLPYPAADRLVMVGESSSRFPGLGPVNPLDFFDWRERNTVFSHLSAVDSYTFDLVDGDEPERVQGAAVSHEFFDLLAVPPVLGRTFRAEDDVVNGERVVVLSHDLWQRRFGGDPDVLGRRLFTTDHAYTVIGVMPDGFRHPEAFWASDIELWMPLSFIDNPLDTRGARYLQTIGRLRDGVSIAQARQDMDVISTALAELYVENAERAALIAPLRDETVGDTGQSLYTLLGAVGLLLVIACVNVANLLLARATGRRREIALRGALGAGAGRLYRQLLTEGVVLSLAGGAGGLALAVGAVQAFRVLHPDGMPRAAEVAIDLRALAFAVVISVATGIVFALAPAFRLTRTDVARALQEGGERGGEGGAGGRLRHALVSGEMALAVMLVVGAGLFATSFVNLRSVDPGFDPADVATLSIALNNSYDTPERQITFFEQLAERVRAIPGVQAAAYSSSLPFGGDRWITSFRIEGRESNPGSPDVAEYSRVSPGFFRTLAIEVVEGREFLATDDLGHDRVAIVNETFARTYWPGESAVGQRLGMGRGSGIVWYTVVGVAHDIQRRGLDQNAEPEFFVSVLQRSTVTAQMVVRVVGRPGSVVDAMRSEAWALDGQLPLTFDSMERLVGNAVSRPRFQTALLGVFATVALVLAGVGVFGTMSYSVGQREREIGIRMALGAPATEVVRMVGRQALAITAAGLGAGVLGALALSRAIEGMLFGVSARDAGTYLLATGFLGVTALVAAYLPAWRAGKSDPLAALRTD